MGRSARRLQSALAVQRVATAVIVGALLAKSDAIESTSNRNKYKKNRLGTSINLYKMNIEKLDHSFKGSDGLIEMSALKDGRPFICERLS